MPSPMRAEYQRWTSDRPRRRRPARRSGRRCRMTRRGRAGAAAVIALTTSPASTGVATPMHASSDDCDQEDTRCRAGRARAKREHPSRGVAADLAVGELVRLRAARMAFHPRRLTDVTHCRTSGSTLRRACDKNPTAFAHGCQASEPDAPEDYPALLPEAGEVSDPAHLRRTFGRAPARLKPRRPPSASSALISTTASRSAASTACGQVGDRAVEIVARYHGVGQARSARPRPRRPGGR